MGLTRAKRFFLGEPLLDQHASEEKLPKWKALSTLSSDALSSVAYATDAILAVLAGFSTAAIFWSIPVALMIAGLLVILTASYRQTIEAYPGGGGAYTVAKKNLGQTASLVAGAALLIDYVLTVSVSVASGIENIGSAFPLLMAHKEGFGMIVVLLIALLNLRGIRENAAVFAFPTYAFILSIFCLVGVGLFKGSSGINATHQSLIHAVYPAVPLVLILRAFASGCSALTGVEAISNGAAVFQAPAQRNAKITLIWMAGILGVLFLGITALAHLYGIVPRPDQTLISLLSRRVFGDHFFYYFVQSSTALILFLAASTTYAHFPRLASLLARDRFLPRQLTSIGDRLVFSNGIIGLSIAAITIILIFHGETIRMLPLYAIGVFLSFTLSQAGMVIHHIREREIAWFRSLLLNGLGSFTTAVVLVDIALTKFNHGAWIVVLFIPLLVFVFTRVHRHYLCVSRELRLEADPDSRPVQFARIRHTVIVPISGIHKGVLEALQYALSISNDVRACYVEIDPSRTQTLQEEWEKWVPFIPFVVLKSPYRSVVQPLISYIDDVEEMSRDDMVTVVVPEFVTRHWWHGLLHNQTALFIRAALALRRRRVVTSVRYHIQGS